jgi:hypothetical protein
MILRERWQRQFGWYTNSHNLETDQLDVDNPPADFRRAFDIVYCYGVLYHLGHPLRAIDFMARCCTSLLLLETSVSLGRDEEVIHEAEDSGDVSQSIHGQGCHPSRPWIFKRLKERFAYVYLPVTQPWHEQFPIDWSSAVETPGRAHRAVFVASRQKLVSPMLVDRLPDQQRRM